MSNYVDRFEKLVAQFNRQRMVKTGWKAMDEEVLKDTFIAGIKPVGIKMLVKQHLPKSVNEAQSIAITEADEEIESSSEGHFDSGSGSDYESDNGKESSSRKNRSESSITKSKTKQKKSKREDKVTKTEVEKKMDDLTESLHKLTLLVESKKGGNQVSGRVISCYNCQE
ncbi:hypothetical protein BD770DRAFT_438334 [Pilaira anomala]|nr:hypothetical protein BD770DRAFT_438334 [Pilaira anomala]